MSHKPLKQIFDEGKASIDKPVMSVLAAAIRDTMVSYSHAKNRAQFGYEMRNFMPETGAEAFISAEAVDAAIEQTTEPHILLSPISTVVESLCDSLGEVKPEALAGSLARYGVRLVGEMMTGHQASRITATEVVLDVLKVDGYLEMSQAN